MLISENDTMGWVLVRFISYGVSDEDYPEESREPGEPSETNEVDDVDVDNEDTVADS